MALLLKGAENIIKRTNSYAKLVGRLKTAEEEMKTNKEV